MEFRDMIAHLTRMLEYLSVTELTEQMLDMSQYRDELHREGTLESKSRLENIDEFLSVTLEFEKRNDDKSLVSFLTDLALIADIDSMNKDEEVKDAVVLMTMHSAKGLEFPVVFICGMEESIFPHSRALNDNEEMEEERRIAYVGITRAEQALFLSCARMRTLFGRTQSNAPSRFLDEIPDELKEVVSPTRQRFGRATGSGSGMGGSGWSQGGRSIGGGMGSSGSTGTGNGTGTVRTPVTSTSSMPNLNRPKAGDFNSGDKVSHAKWGIGTIVQIKGSGDDTELQIAFPAPVGIKRLLAGFAPITKVE
jgi:DNA helicase-2/ATP-dependent DNA helicase PcrA